MLRAEMTPYAPVHPYAPVCPLKTVGQLRLSFIKLPLTEHVSSYTSKT